MLRTTPGRRASEACRPSTPRHGQPPRLASALPPRAPPAPGAPDRRPTPPPASPLLGALAAAALALGPALSADAAQRVFLDVSIDAQPAGRIVVKTFDDVPVGAARFADLARDRGGVGYVRSKFDAVSPGAYIASSGVASLSYADVSEGGGSVQIAGGETVEELVRELGERKHSSDGARVVSLVVAPDPVAAAKPVKTKLVAMNGKFVTVEDPRGSVRAPNGTGFVITLAPGQGAALDATNLAVGEVEPGAEALLDRISRLKAAQPTSGSPYFKLAKTLGDRRADVAERYFLRPFQKVVITASGLLE